MATRLGAGARGAADAWAQVARSGPLRRAQLSFAAMWAGEAAVMVAVGVVAFRDGGVAAVGIVTALRMAPAALLAPFAAAWADRVRRERVLAWVGLRAGGDARVRRRRPGHRRADGGGVRRDRPGDDRVHALPAGALGAAARAVPLAAGAGERERRPRAARLGGDARRPARRRRAARGERPGRRVRGLRRRLAVGGRDRRDGSATTRRRAPSGPDQGGRALVRGLALLASEPRPAADHGDRGDADGHPRRAERAARRRGHRPARRRRRGRRLAQRGGRRRRRARRRSSRSPRCAAAGWAPGSGSASRCSARR